MKYLASLIAMVVLQSLSFVSGLHASSFLPIPPPVASVSTSAIGINDRGQVVGSLSTDGLTDLAYIRSSNGVYQTFQVDGNTTQARGINNQGIVTGFYAPPGIILEFVRTPDGTISDITKESETLIGIVQGINAAGEFVGDYVREPGSVPLRGGYIGRDALFEADVDLPFAALRVAARGINANGDIAGWFVDENGGLPQGFIIRNGVTMVLSYPAPGATTFVQGLNNRGQLSGSWVDAEGNNHGFMLASDLATWTSFDVPGSEQTEAFQINNLGQIAVVGAGPAGTEAYIYCPGNAGVCAGNPTAHLPANETVVMGEALSAPAQPAAGSVAVRHRHIEK